MKKYCKRAVSLIMTIAMCLNLFCSPVWAADIGAQEALSMNEDEMLDPGTDENLLTEPLDPGEDQMEGVPEQQAETPNESLEEKSGTNALDVVSVTSAMEYYSSVAQMVKEEDSMITSSSGGKFENARLLIKDNGSGVDFSAYEGARRVVTDEEGHYTVQFATSQQAEAAYDRLGALSAIDYVEADGKMTLLSSENEGAEIRSGAASTHNSWGISHIGADEYASYAQRTSTRTIKVAVVDTGVDASHTYLEGRVLNGYDFVDNDANPMDEHYHGTHVAGTVVDCTLGLANIKIIPIRVLNARGSGTSSGVSSGIRYAADSGADIINLSLGGSHNAAVDEAIHYATGKGALCVVAAGNDNIDIGTDCPAHIEEALTVSAVNSSEGRASFSNHGTAVDLCAPGVDITSCVPGGSYRTLNGTSMATPHAAACAALLKLKDPSLTPAQLEQAMQGSCRDLGSAGKDAYYGYGIIDLRLSIDEVPATLSPSKTSVGLSSGTSERITLTAGGDLPSGYGLSYSINGAGFSCELDENGWYGSYHDLIIHGEEAGRGTLTVYLEDTSTHSLLATARIDVRVGSIPYPLGGTVTDWRHLESAHGYADDSDYTWIYTDIDASRGMTLTFSGDTATESGYDYIYIYSGNATDADDILVGTYTGDELSGQQVNVPGNTVKIRLTSDFSVSSYGFKVTDLQTTTVRYPEGAPLVGDWHDLESCHNYKNNSDYTWTYTTPGNADSLAVTFSEDTRVESGCDRIYIYDENGTPIEGGADGHSGTGLAGRTVSVPGKTVQIRLVSDSSVNYYGFRVSDLRAVTSGGNSNDTIVDDWSRLESEHNYANDFDHTWVYTHTESGISGLDVTFNAQTKTENINDHIYIYTGDNEQVGDYTGTELAGKTISVEGDKIKIRLTSDSSINYYGFKVDNVAGITENTDNPYPESEHNYKDECNDIKEWTAEEKEAKSLDVTFDERTKVEDRHDHISLYGVYMRGDETVEELVGKYTGTELAGRTIRVPGRKVKIQLTSDSSLNFYGYKVTRITPVYSDVVIAAETAQVYSGGSVEIPVTIQNNPGIAGFSLDIDYDESLLTLSSIGTGSLIQDKGSFSTNRNIINWYSSAGNVVGDGTLMNLRFRVNSSAAAGRTPVSISLHNGKDKKNNLVDEDGKFIEAIFQGSMVDILGGLLGDMTGDGELTMADVVILNRAILELVVLDQRQESLARIAGSDYVSMADVVRLNRIILGLDPQARAGKRNAKEDRSLQNTAKVTVGNGSVPKGGGQVTLPVEITGNSGISAFGFQLTLPEGYTFDSVETGELLKDLGAVTKGANNKATWFEPNGTNMTGNGVLFNLKLTVGADALTGPVSVALIDGKGSNLCDVQGNTIPVEFTEGTVTVDDGSSDPAKDISQASVDAIPDQIYTGAAIQPSVTIKDGDKTLTEGTDYTATYQDNTNIGTATVTITGKGSYTGSITQTFIIKASTSDEGKAKIKVGSASVSKDGGSVSLPVEITGNSGIAAFGFALTIPSGYTFDSVETGALLKDKGEVTKSANGRINWSAPDNTDAIGDGVLFNIQLTAAKDAATGTVSVALIDGNESELCDAQGKAVPVEFEAGTVTVGDGSSDPVKDINRASVDAIPDQIYTGEAMRPTVTVKEGDKTLTEGTDYTVAYKDNIDIGTATVTITGKGNYTGSITQTFIIKRSAPENVKTKIKVGSASVPKEGGKVSLPVEITGNSGISAFGFKLTVPDGYTFDSVETGVLLKDKGEVKKGVNDQITWYDPSGKNVTGDGVLFKIHLIAEKDAPAASVSIALMGGKEDNLCDEQGNAIPVVFENGTLTVGSDNTGDDDRPDTDTKKNIRETFIDKIQDQTYTGRPITPGVTVKDGNKTLQKGTDYTVSYSDNRNVGTATIKITGKGNYTGTKTIQFLIKRPQLRNLTRTISVGGNTLRVKTTKAGKATIAAVTSRKKSITIPSRVTVEMVSYTVTTIGPNAFSRAKKATKITIPRSVKLIQRNAFKGAKKLKTLKLDINKPTQIKIQKGVFSGLNTKKMSIKVNIFTSNKMLKNIRKTLKKAGFKGRVGK